MSLIRIRLLIVRLVSDVLQPEPCQEPVAEGRVVGSARDVQVVAGVCEERGVAPVVVHDESCGRVKLNYRYQE